MKNYQVILVAVDFSEHVDVVLSRAVSMAQGHKAAINLAHVVEYMPPMVMGDEPLSIAAWPVDDDKLLELARQQMQVLADKYSLNDAPVHIELGRPVHQLCQIASECNADLIIAGSHGRRGIDRLLGSTASALVHKTPCDLLLVKIK